MGLMRSVLEQKTKEALVEIILDMQAELDSLYETLARVEQAVGKED